MSFFDEADCELSEIALDNLTPDEENGLMLIPGAVVFADLVDPAEVMKSLRYSITFRTPKDGVIKGRTAEDGTELTYGSVLFAIAQRVADKVWGENSPNTEAVWGALDAGVNRKSSPFGVQDGDLSQYPNDKGHWIVKATRAENKGRPALYALDGSAIYGPNIEEDDGEGRMVLTNGELVGDDRQVPDFGDIASVLIRLWAMEGYDRLNIEVVGVKLEVRGANMSSGGGRAKAIAAEQNALTSMATGGVAALPSNLTLPAAKIQEGAEEEEEAQSKKRTATKKKPAPKKAAAKKKKAAAKKVPRNMGGRAAKKKSVFRK